MTREERFKMDMIDEFKLMCEIVGNSGRIIANKHRMLKALEQEPFMNKTCVSSEVCEHDKKVVLDKIRAEIEQLRPNLRPEQMTDYDYAMVDAVNDIAAIIDKCKAESEVKANENEK